MKAYRIAPWDPRGGPKQLFKGLAAVRSGQQSGRWDNSRLYGALYLALSQAGAVAEVLGGHARWTDDVFDAPAWDCVATSSTSRSTTTWWRA